jgi:hypothetical protein
MAQRRHHYERAFEAFLRARRIPYVAVDEAKKALLPEGATIRCERTPGDPGPSALKSFDFVIYGESTNLLVDVKGRRVGSRTRNQSTTAGRLESWVTEEDVDSLARWARLFGPGFEPAFVFIYWCEQQPPDALFQEIVEFRGAWYALRAVGLQEYAAAMKVRSVRWRTVHVPAQTFERISRPFAPPVRSGGPERLGNGSAVGDPGPVVPFVSPHQEPVPTLPDDRPASGRRG